MADDYVILWYNHSLYTTICCNVGLEPLTLWMVHHSPTSATYILIAEAFRHQALYPTITDIIYMYIIFPMQENVTANEDWDTNRQLQSKKEKKQPPPPSLFSLLISGSLDSISQSVVRSVGEAGG